MKQMPRAYLVMEQFESEIELLAAIYGEELERTATSLTLHVLPQRDSEELDFVQARVRVETVPNLHVSLSLCKGLDPEQIATLTHTLTAKLLSLQQESADSPLYALFEHSKEALTALNESVAGECTICLEDLGELCRVVRVPGCFHRFHKRCLRKMWLGNWTEAKKRSCEELSQTTTFKLACALCRHSVALEEARKVLS